MRITNTMMSNTMLGNINRNMNTVNTLFNQIATGSLISRPSDNPLMASRALRIRNTQSQITQYQRNVNQANSWMQITEQAINDLLEIAGHIQELLQRADSVETLDDKQKIATEISSLLDEMAAIMNRNPTGRYIFSGLRTNEPPFFTRDQPDLAFTDITTSFNRRDIETVNKLCRSTSPPRAQEVNRIRIPHGGDEGSVRINGEVAQPVPRDADGNVMYSEMTPDGIYHNSETGEIFFGNEAMAGLTFPLEVMYDQTGFRAGDLNPKVFFTVTDDQGRVFTMDNQNMEFEFGVNTRIQVNVLGSSLGIPKMYAELRGFANDILSLQPTSEEDVRDYFMNQGLTGDELDERVREHMEKERAAIETVTNDKFNNMIGRMDYHHSNLSVQQTDLGTRMGRVEMIEERLEDDAITFEELATNNHGADIVELMMKLSTAQVALTASMQVGMQNMRQMSLLNFL